MYFIIRIGMEKLLYLFSPRNKKIYINFLCSFSFFHSYAYMPTSTSNTTACHSISTQCLKCTRLTRNANQSFPSLTAFGTPSLTRTSPDRDRVIQDPLLSCVSPDQKMAQPSFPHSLTHSPIHSHTTPFLTALHDVHESLHFFSRENKRFTLTSPSRVLPYAYMSISTWNIINLRSLHLNPVPKVQKSTRDKSFLPLH